VGNNYRGGGAQGRKTRILIFQWVAFPTLRQTFHCFI
jgi:hypothetical protein